MLIRGVLVVTRVLEGNKFTNLCNNFSSFRKLSSTCNKMPKTACVFIAKGSEEIEAVISVDVLRRGGIDVLVAGIPDSSVIQCSRDVNVKPDIGISDAKSRAPFDVIVLPGGLGGSKAFIESKELGELLKEQANSGRLVAAICAAPTALKAHGIGEGKNVTSYPLMKETMLEGNKYTYLEENVVVDGNIITSRGPGTSFQFALTVVEKLAGKEKAVEVAKAMLVNY